MSIMFYNHLQWTILITDTIDSSSGFREVTNRPSVLIKGVSSLGRLGQWMATIDRWLIKGVS